MIRVLTVILLTFVLAGCVNRSTTNSPDMSNVQFASPAPEEGAMPGVPITNENLLKEALASMLNTGVNNLELIITADENIFAAGRVSILDTNKELQWYAVKKKGGWQIISASQDLLHCRDLAAYPDFPKNLIPQCQTDQGQTITR